MKTYTVRVATVGPYTDITNEQQCFHDIVLDDLVGIGPVSSRGLSNAASITLTYARPHASHVSIVFHTRALVEEEREKLVKAWKEYNKLSNHVMTIDGVDGNSVVDLTGLLMFSQGDGDRKNHLVLVYRDGQSVGFAFTDQRDKRLAEDKLTDYLKGTL